MSKWWRYVNVKSCVATIIVSLIAACIAFVPFAFSPLALTYTKLPFIGDGTIFASSAKAATDLLTLLPIGGNEFVANLLNNAYAYFYYAYFGILAANIVFALVLSILRFNALRIIFRILSIFFGIAMILLTVLAAGYVFIYVYAAIKEGGVVSDILNRLTNDGILFHFVMFIFGLIFIGRQFSWFAKP